MSDVLLWIFAFFGLLVLAGGCAQDPYPHDNRDESEKK